MRQQLMSPLLPTVNTLAGRERHTKREREREREREKFIDNR
jgi:hypothetical protein